MYVVTGASGQTGFVVAEYLLKKTVEVRVVLRDPKKARAWKEMGADVFIGDVTDPESMKEAFKNATGAYLMNPPALFLDDPFKMAVDVGKAYAYALQKNNLKRVVVLSSIGAQLENTGIIHSTTILEKQLEKVSVPKIFLRAAYFMENWKASLMRFSKVGIFSSTLLPLDRAIPMVSVQDIGNTAAKLLIEEWDKSEILGLEGPKKYSPLDVAKAAAHLCRLPENCVEVPHRDWRALFGEMKFSPRAIEAYCDMLDAFKEDRIKYGTETRLKGEVSIENALQLMQPVPI